ncbi:MAG: hypothetical protein IT349_00220 [Candidatus Eisenbacteria bacterium]|nr:hypothetical protein [Candidatus Eisenbacteria bacterium]MCC7140498.1 hypothetical protein [Candidatus Eisenbacteria bacterium]
MLPAPPSRAALQRVLPILMFGFGTAPIFYGAVLYLILGSGGSGSNSGTARIGETGALTWMFGTLGLVAALFSAMWTRLRVSPAVDRLVSDAASGDQAAGAQRDVIVALAGAEACAMAGLVLGILTRDLGAYLPFGAATLGLMAVVILPPVLRILHR